MMIVWPGRRIASSGKPVKIFLGNTVELGTEGVFGRPHVCGPTDGITVRNRLQGNPHEVLLDQDGNPIYVNKLSGMKIGLATMTPQDAYRVWFENHQQIGSVVEDNFSSYKDVHLNGEQSASITFNENGDWVDGAPA